MGSMEKAEIIKEFIKNGFQLEPEALNYLIEKENIKYVLEELKKLPSSPPTITVDMLKNIEKKLVYNIEILRVPEKQEKIMDVLDFTNFFSSRYEKLRKILANHLDLVNLISINKISQKTRKFSLIAMIREKNKDEKSLMVEDFTGEQTIFFENFEEDFKFILEDEILGFTCEKEGEKIFMKKVVFPEIPLKREINKTKEDVFCLFISDFHMDNENFNKKSYENFLNWINNSEYKKLYVFILGDISSKGSDVEKFLANLPKDYFYILLKGEIDPEIETQNLFVLDPCYLKIENSLNFLLLHSKLNFPSSWSDLPPNKILLNFLKKRQIHSQVKEVFVRDPYIIDIIPDFMVSGHFHKPSFLNYKGTTIITTGSFITEPIFWLANLRTRETIKIDFS